MKGKNINRNDILFSWLLNVAKLMIFLLIIFGSFRLFFMFYFGDIEQGENIAFHIDGTFVSFFDPFSKEIRFGPVLDKDSFKSIKIFNKKDPYFTPNTVLLTPMMFSTMTLIARDWKQFWLIR